MSYSIVEKSANLPYVYDVGTFWVDYIITKFKTVFLTDFYKITVMDFSKKAILYIPKF